MPHTQSGREPIALVGIGCRFPGGVYDPVSYWKLLCEGVDAIQEIPADRIDVDRYYDPRPGTPGKMSTRWGGFLENIDSFDAAFFGISPREAERMDPQQRLLLEVAWEALEDAGQDEARLAQAQAGVFVGVWLNDFEARLFRYPAEVDFYMTTGSGRYTAAGRISYCLGLQGPSLSLDTACSSSLVAVHLACQSLWVGECTLALAGGVNVILQPHITIAYSQSKMMAADGRCKFGDSRADGYVRSEGAGVVVLKRLSQALADGDQIYALIRGSAVNNDGRSSGYLTTPAVEGQERLLKEAYRNADVSPGDVDYVEAHGTGTHAGDPVEIQALGRVLARGRAPGRLCAVGSVKTNLGHTEGAAGMAGLIKTALALQQRQIPASLHLEALNPEIPWDKLPVYIPRELTLFPDSDRPLIGGVSSFGIAGTNAHVVLEEAPRQETRVRQERQAWDLLLLSGRTEEALRASARAFSQFFAGEDAPALQDACYTTRKRRTHHEHRLALAIQDRTGAAAALDAFAQGQPPPGIMTAQAIAGRPTKTVFVFPGQGSQWPGMARELLKEQPIFREALARFDQAIRPFVDWSILEQLALVPGDPGYRMDEIGVIQPALLGIEIALAELWQSWGIEPDAVIGHSLGEVGAAYLAGALTLQDTARIICLRSRLLQRIRGQGGMALVGLPADKAQEAIQSFAGRLSIAVSNSASSTVIAGEPEALNQAVALLQARDIFCRPVKVDVAAHSPQVEPLLPELGSGLAGLQPRPGGIPFYSTAAGQVEAGESLGAAYWELNLRSPVRFAAMTEQLLEDGFTLFVELSPHPVLLSAIEDTIHRLEKEAAAVPSLWRGEPEFASLLRAAGKMHASGFPVDFGRIFPAEGQLVRLPQYPWQRKRFWLEAANARADWQPGRAEMDPLLGARLPELAHLPGHTLWENRADGRFRRELRSLPGDMPDSLYEKMALVAASSVERGKLHTLLSIHTTRPMELKEGEELFLQSVFVKEDEKNARYRLYSRMEAGLPWEEHVSALVHLGQAPAGWLHQVKWVKKASSPSRQAGFISGGRWLIFADQGGLGAALAEHLKIGGQTCLLVFRKGDAGEPAADQEAIDPGRREDFVELLDRVGPVSGILYLWGMDLAGKETANAASLNANLPLAAHAPLYLAQALAKRGGEPAPRLWIVTRDAQDAGQKEAYPDGKAFLPGTCLQALAWGLGGSLALELPGVWGGLIDLPVQADLQAEAEMLVQETAALERERGVAYRGGERLVARLIPGSTEREEIRPVEVRPDATYLITGGLGNVGLALAVWLAGEGARHIVLTSRTGLPERDRWGEIPPDSPAGKRIRAIEAIEAATGASVTAARADTADLAQMGALYAELGQEHPPVRGVFHAAGTTAFRPLQEIEAGTLDEALRPKVIGTWVLNELTRDIPLDFFVLFSSGASIWGSQGLAHYAAANSYLDAAARFRSSQGLPALSIDWGWWAGGGMVSGEMAQLFQRAGLQEMPEGQAIEAMSHLLCAGEGQHIVAAIDWDVFKPLYEASGPQPFLEEIQVQGGSASPTGEASSSELLQQLSQAGGQERKGLLVQHLRAQVAAILGFDTPDAIDIRQGFFKLGMDSMMTMQLRTRLEAALSCSLPPTLAFEYPSIATLADFLNKEILPQATPAEAAPAGAPGTDRASARPAEETGGAAAEEITASGEDLLDLLDQELSEIDDLLEGI